MCCYLRGSDPPGTATTQQNKGTTSLNNIIVSATKPYSLYNEQLYSFTVFFSISIHQGFQDL